jgi:hypothetical protein
VSSDDGQFDGTVVFGVAARGIDTMRSLGLESGVWPLADSAVAWDHVLGPW